MNFWDYDEGLISSVFVEEPDVQKSESRTRGPMRELIDFFCGFLSFLVTRELISFCKYTCKKSGRSVKSDENEENTNYDFIVERKFLLACRNGN